jgi:nucleoside-diphosphate kinase
VLYATINNMQHISKEKTLVIVKPDGVQRNLEGEILNRYMSVGLKIIGLKMLLPTEDMIRKHYTLDPNWLRFVGEKSIKGLLDKGVTPPSNDPLVVAESVLGRLVRSMTSGPVIAIVFQGAHAVEVVRKITGNTEPLQAAIGTIRGDYSIDSYQMSMGDGRAIRNIVHSSGSVKEAEDEINHWFKLDEILDYDLSHDDVIYGK